MPIVYIHGVAVRDDDPVLARSAKRFREVPWPTIQSLLSEHVASSISDDPAGVPVMRIYWGDLGAQFAWGGRSLVSRPIEDARQDTADSTAEGLRAKGIRNIQATVSALRRPLEDFVPVFLGDVLTYVARRGTADAPGPIPQRVLAGLETAAFAASARNEPLVVVTHSMGGQVLYDVLTHFLPRMPQHRHIRVDFWCATASQVGFFEELGLFLESTPRHGDDPAVRTPLPPTAHLGGWWNVWDHADLLSFRADGIFEGVDDAAFFTGGTLASEHNRYLASVTFHQMLAEKIRGSLDVEGRLPRST
jgi:hypothetical protein